MPELLIRILSYAAVGVAAYGAVLFSWPDPELAQPAAFPHAAHVALNISCVACHTGAEGETQARLPSIKACALCHRAGLSFPSTPPQLAAFIVEDREIPWRQAQQAPEHVYFSHRRHVGAAKLTCDTCHGNVGGAVRALGRPYLLTGEAGMTQCIDCHRSSGASEDCMACHR